MKRMLIAAAVCMAMSMTAPGHAEETGTALTWVRHFTVQPQHGERFVELLKQYDAPVFDGMLEEGKALSWGIAEPFVRGGEPWTHAIWVTTTDWSDIDVLMSRFEQSHMDRTDSENEKIKREFMTMMDSSTMFDRVFRHTVRVMPEEEMPSAEVPAYLRMSFYKVRPFHEEKLKALYERHAAPVYRDLLDQGTILGAGLCELEVMNTGDYTHMSWMSIGSLADMERIADAFEHVEKQRTPGEQERMETDVETAIAFESYRSTILHVLHYAEAN